MHAEFLLNVFSKNKNKDALIRDDGRFTYGNLTDEHCKLKRIFSEDYGIGSQNTVALKADFTITGISSLIALVDLKCILIPLNYSSNKDTVRILEISEAEYVIEIDPEDRIKIIPTGSKAQNINYKILKERNHPGLVLFSSGTTGEPKAALHDFANLLKKFKTPGKSYSTINFLLFDHWGGLNTMFSVLSNGGTLISLRDRSPDYVCKVIETYKAELLPSSPTFLNLMMISEAYKRYDLSSLKIITYGTEPMPESTLKKLVKIFPDVKFKQTYGLIETGVMSSVSKENDSLWVKLGGEGFKTRVVDNMLQIKSESSIICYLNYPSPFTEDGWFITGDVVETDGEYFKILGRNSDIINVGGEKVFPAEVESVIKELDEIKEVRIYGEKNPLTGNIVCADVSCFNVKDKSEFKKQIRLHCSERLQRFKIPVKIKFKEEIESSERFKKKL